MPTNSVAPCFRSFLRKYDPPLRNLPDGFTFTPNASLRRSERGGSRLSTTGVETVDALSFLSSTGLRTFPFLSRRLSMR